MSVEKEPERLLALTRSEPRFDDSFSVANSVVALLWIVNRWPGVWLRLRFYLGDELVGALILAADTFGQT